MLFELSYWSARCLSASAISRPSAINRNYHLGSSHVSSFNFRCDDLSCQPDVDETSGEVDVSTSGAHCGEIRCKSESLANRAEHTVHHVRMFNRV